VSTITLNSEQFNLLLDEIKSLKTEVRLLHNRLDRTHYSISEAAKTWQVSARTVSRWIKSGKVQILNTSGNPKISLEEVIRIQKEEL